MKKIFNKRISVIFTLVILLLIVNVILSFSFMLGKFNNQESVSTLGFKGGNINVIYSNNSSDIIATDIVPGYSVTKQFSITSDFGTSHSYYNNPLWYTIKIIVDKNEFDDNSIKYSINLDESSSKDGMPFGSNLEEGILKGQNLEGVTVGSGAFYNDNQTHVYNLTISYPETRHNQTHEINCEFAAHVEITNPTLINVTFDLKDGASDGLMLDSSNSMKVPANSTIYFSKFFLEVINGDVEYNLDNGVLKTHTTDISLKVLYFITNFDYTGAEQTYVVPVSGYYKLEAWGASGNNNYNSYTLQNSSYAGYTSGNIYLSKNELLYLYVGGQGNTFNCCSKQGSNAGSGGATDVRLVSGEWNNTSSLTSRIMVAGGAGGAYTDSSAPGGGSAGGLTSYSVSHGSHPVAASTQVSGGTAGYNGTAGGFGYGGTNSNSNYNSGAGGYYGGGSGPAGGGGSSYISGHTGCVAIVSDSSTSARTGTGGVSCTTGTSDNLCSVHYSGKVLDDTVMIDGAGYSWANTKGALQQMPNPSGGYYASGVGHSGNGYARITYLHS